MDTLIIDIVKYGLIPLLTVICSVLWFLYKKQDTRIDNLEKRMTDVEKAVIEIKTEFTFIGRDLKNIHDLLLKLLNDK